MLVSPVTFNRLVLSSSSSSSRTDTPLTLDNYSLNKKKCDFVVSATPSKGRGGGGGGNLWRRNRQQRRNEDNSSGYGSDSEENEIAASGVVGQAVLAKIRGADLKEKGTANTITTPRTAKLKKAVPSSTTTSLNGSDVLMALLNTSNNKSSNKKRRKGTRSTSYTKRGDDEYTSSSEDEDEENNSLMRPLHIKKEWGSKLDDLGRSLEELIRLHDSR